MKDNVRSSKRNYQWLIGLITVAFIVLGAGVTGARAAVMLNSPFGANVPVNVIVGAFNTAPGQAIVWQRVSDGACQFKIIGDGAGLNDGYEVHGSTGNDIMFVVETPPGTAYTFCGGTYVSLRYNGHFLDIFGGGGNDNITTATGDTWIWGEAGNDHLLTRNMFGIADGGDGNDTILSFNGTGSSETLRGQAGNDCIQDSNGATLILDCGPGTDKVSSASAPPVRTDNCETTITTGCP